MDEDSSTEQKTWQVYSFGKRNVIIITYDYYFDRYVMWACNNTPVWSPHLYLLRVDAALRGIYHG